MVLTWDELASIEWISRISRRTFAVWLVVVDFTDGINPACTRTWVDALLVDASLVKGTVAAQKAFRVAAVPWVTSEPW
jgi:hypothetical protein